jgi:hypothetical protein
MKPHIKVEVTVGTLRSLTAEQFAALQERVLAEGQWETASGLYVSCGGDYAGVEPLDEVHARMIFLGIERDGYVHS